MHKCELQTIQFGLCGFLHAQILTISTPLVVLLPYELICLFEQPQCE